MEQGDIVLETAQRSLKDSLVHVLACLPADASTELAESLVELGQAHLFESWPPAGEQDEEKRQMLAQLAKLEANYPGGLAAYIQSARNLLGQSVRGENPLQGWSPSVPDDGFDLTPGSDEFERYEERGLAEAAHMAFAVPAGGLGERLGFSGVKFALPAEISTGATVLQVYVAYILAVQRHAEAKGGGRCRLPLAIMVSDDTAEGIQRLLDANDHFGLEPAQVTLLKQEKVAALADSDARLALKGPFEVATLSLSLSLSLSLTPTPTLPTDR